VARRYNVGCKPHEYRVGDTICYRLTLVRDKVTNFPAKMLMRWSRHVEVPRVVGPNLVLFANPETGVIIRRAHVSHLKTCMR
jgi:hypothetical protein